MNFFFRNRWLQEIIFWMVSWVILFKIFSSDYANGLSDIIYTTLFHLPLLIAVFSHYQIIHRTFVQKKFGLYLILLLIILNGATLFYFLLFNKLSDSLFPGYYFIAYYNYFDIILFIASYLIMTLLIELARRGYALEKKQQILEKESENIKLQNLKNKINPHFLFNSLNNIFGSIPKELENTRSYIIKLTDTLRYMIYESEEEWVPLNHEIEYINDYIALEKLRLENSDKIKLILSGNFDGFLFPPLILLPLVENCFKHSHQTHPEISVSIKCLDNFLILKTKNNIDTESEVESGKFGLSNLQKRLELQYPNRYTLEKGEIGEYYQLSLKIKLEK